MAIPSVWNREFAMVDSGRALDRQMEKRFVSGGIISGLKSCQAREHLATVNARGMGRRTETRFSLEHELRIRGSITIRDDVKCVRGHRGSPSRFNSAIL